jgi:hypothetical protein
MSAPALFSVIISLFFRGDPKSKEIHVCGVAGAVGLLRPDQQFLASNGDRYSFDRLDLDSTVGCRRVIDPTRLLQEIDDDLVGNTNDPVFLDFIICDECDGVVRQERHRAFESRDIRGRRINQKVDVFGCTHEAVQDDRRSRRSERSEHLRRSAICRARRGLRAQARVSIRDHPDHPLVSLLVARESIHPAGYERAAA